MVVVAPKDSKKIFKDAFEVIRNRFLDLKPDDDIDLQKLKPFLELARKNAYGEDSTRELEDLRKTDLNTKEVEFLANVTTEVARTQHFSETLAKHQKDIVKTIVKNRLKKMKDAGLPYKEIMDTFRYTTSEESITTHPTYVGSPEYTKAHAEYLEVYDKFTNGKATEGEFGDAFAKVMNSPFTKEERLSVEEEREYVLQILRKMDDSKELLYEVYDEVLAEEFEEYRPKDLVLNLVKSVWGAGMDVDGNTAIFNEDTANTFLSLLVEGIDANLKRFKKINDPDKDKIVSDLEAFKELLIEDLANISEENYQDLVQSAIAISEEIFDKTNSKEALSAYRYIRDNGLKLGRGDYRQTAEVFDDVLKNIIPLGVIREFAGEDIKDTVENFADLNDLNKVKIENYKDLINKVAARINNGSAEKFIENYEQLVEFLANPPEKMSKLQNDFFAEIQYEISTEIQKKITESILGDDVRFSQKVIGSWIDDAMNDLESRMEKDPELKRQVTKTYDHADSYFYQEVKRAKLVASLPDDMMRSHQLAEGNRVNDSFKPGILYKGVGAEHVMFALLHEKPQILERLDEVYKEALSSKVNYQIHVELGIPEFEKKFGKIPDDIKDDLKKLDPSNTSEFQKSLSDIDSRLKDAFKDKFTYRDYKSGETINMIGVDSVVQIEIEMAHSDNQRRAGNAPARALLSSAIDKVKLVAEKFGVGVKWFHGMSVTSPMRGGMRAMSRTFNQFKEFLFQKHTTQNIDGMVLYPNEKTGAIFLADKMSNASLNLTRKEGAAPDPRPQGSLEVQKVLEYMRDELNIRDQIAGVYKYHQNQYFYQEVTGYEMAQIHNGADHKNFGNVASRQNSRKKGDPAVKPEFFQPPSAVRSITNDEAKIHVSDSDYYLTARPIMRILVESAEKIRAKIEKDPDFKKVFDHGMGGAISTEHIFKKMFDIDPDLAEQKNRMAQAVAASNIDFIWQRALELEEIKNKNGIGVYEYINKRPSPEELEELAKTKDNGSVAGLLAFRELQHKAAAELVHIAFTGTKPNQNMTPAQASGVAKVHLNDINKLHADSNKQNVQLMQVLNRKLKESVLGQPLADGFDALYSRVGKAIHNMRDIFAYTVSPIKNPGPAMGLDGHHKRT